MAATIVIGSQWGDEGKGKIIDYLAEKSDIVVRFHGGNNAGHTVINKFGPLLQGNWKQWKIDWLRRRALA